MHRPRRALGIAVVCPLLLVRRGVPLSESPLPVRLTSAPTGEHSAAAPETPKRSHKFAVLVDAENARHQSMGAVLSEIASFGDTSIRRCYGDFTNPALSGWKTVALDLSFKRVNADSYAKGKGSADSQMIIEAMDFLYTTPLDGFCLVSSDSDFTGLAQRLREACKTVIGFGERKTPAAFVKACDRFIYVENLDDFPPPPTTTTVPTTSDSTGGSITSATSTTSATGAGAESTASTASSGSSSSAVDVVAPDLWPSGPFTEPFLVRLLETAVDAKADEEGWAHLGDIGMMLTHLKSDFDSRTYGCKKLSGLFERYDASFFELKKKRSTLYVRRRPGAEDISTEASFTEAIGVSDGPPTWDSSDTNTHR